MKITLLTFFAISLLLISQTSHAGDDDDVKLNNSTAQNSTRDPFQLPESAKAKMGMTGGLNKIEPAAGGNNK